jgi:hypothetical protein
MSEAQGESTGIAHGANNVKAGVADFVDFWEGDGGDRAPSWMRIRSLKSEAFL